MGRVTVRRPVRRISATGDRRRPDALAAEEPLELRVGGKALAVTMRTPGHDVELAHGFLLTEGVIGEAADVATARYCDSVDDTGRNTYNVLDVALAPGVPPPATGLERTFYTTSSCGLCGRASIDAVRTRSAFTVAGDPLVLGPEAVTELPGRLRAEQAVFDKTGGLHAAGLFDGVTGELLVVREDVGRHNAVDKVVGWAAQAGRLPLRGSVLMVSGRASFELTQKALMAGIPVLAAVSAPSSLAVEMAAEAGLTLVGFLRGESMVVYAGGQRIGQPAPPVSGNGHRLSRVSPG